MDDPPEVLEQLIEQLEKIDSEEKEARLKYLLKVWYNGQSQMVKMESIKAIFKNMGGSIEYILHDEHKRLYYIPYKDINTIKMYIQSLNGQLVLGTVTLTLEIGSMDEYNKFLEKGEEDSDEEETLNDILSDSEEEEEKINYLIDFDETLLWKVCRYLDIRSLIKLSLTCSKFKNWIKNEKHYRHLSELIIPDYVNTDRLITNRWKQIYISLSQSMCYHYQSVLGYNLSMQFLGILSRYINPEFLPRAKIEYRIEQVMKSFDDQKEYIEISDMVEDNSTESVNTAIHVSFDFMELPEELQILILSYVMPTTLFSMLTLNKKFYAWIKERHSLWKTAAEIIYHQKRYLCLRLELIDPTPNQSWFVEARRLAMIETDRSQLFKKLRAYFPHTIHDKLILRIVQLNMIGHKNFDDIFEISKKYIELNTKIVSGLLDGNIKQIIDQYLLHYFLQVPKNTKENNPSGLEEEEWIVCIVVAKLLIQVAQVKAAISMQETIYYLEVATNILKKCASPESLILGGNQSPLYLMGIVNQQLGQSRKSNVFYKRFITLSEKYNQTNYLADVYQQLGYAELNNHSRSCIKYFEKAIELEGGYNFANPKIVTMLTGLGMGYVRIGDRDNARRIYNMLSEHNKNAFGQTDKKIFLETSGHIGVYCFPERKFEYFEHQREQQKKALVNFQTSSYTAAIPTTCYVIAVACGHTGRKSEMIEYFERAVHSYLDLMLNIGKQNEKYIQSWFEAVHHPFLHLFYLYFEKGQPENSLVIIEKFRSFSLMLVLSQFINEYDLQQVQMLKRLEIRDLKLIAGKRNQYILVFVLLKKITSPFAKYFLPPFSPLSEDILYSFLITPYGLIKSRKHILNQPQMDLLQNESANLRYGNLVQLYELLIRPFDNFLPKSENQEIVIVNDPSLNHISFSSLYDVKTKKYFIQKHLFSFSPTTILLDSLTKIKLSKLENPSNDFLLVGNPDYSTVASLPESGLEIEGIKKHLESKNSNMIVLTKKKASKKRFFKALKNSKPSIIHVAAHCETSAAKNKVVGEYDVRGRILLAESKKSKVPDVYANELKDYMTSFEKSELVVLSACGSAKGKNVANGVLGFYRALFSTSVPSVICSVFKVVDRFAKEVMIRFYKDILDRQDSLSCNLRNSILEAIEEFNLWNQPEVWAPLVLYGDGGPLSRNLLRKNIFKDIGDHPNSKVANIIYIQDYDSISFGGDILPQLTTTCNENSINVHHLETLSLSNLVLPSEPNQPIYILIYIAGIVVSSFEDYHLLPSNFDFHQVSNVKDMSALSESVHELIIKNSYSITSLAKDIYQHYNEQKKDDQEIVVNFIMDTSSDAIPSRLRKPVERPLVSFIPQDSSISIDLYFCNDGSSGGLTDFCQFMFPKGPSFHHLNQTHSIYHNF